MWRSLGPSIATKGEEMHKVNSIGGEMQRMCEEGMNVDDGGQMVALGEL